MRHGVASCGLIAFAAGIADAVQTGGLLASSPALRPTFTLAQQRHQNSSMTGAALRNPNISFVIAPTLADHLNDKHSILDTFVIAYWGTVFSVMALVVVGTAMRGDREEDDGCQSSQELESAKGGFPDTELPENMWSFNFVTAMGQAKFSSGKRVPIALVAIISLFMGALQLFTIFLIVHDIDPAAEPITSDPTSPWKKTTWTVNTMKWIMVLFLVMGMVPEVSDCQRVFEAIVEVDASRLDVPKIFSMTMTLCHYLITLGVIWGGVNAICSFGAVPDIVYSSLAITFLAGIDNIFYEFFCKMFDVDADFTIAHKQGEKTDVKRWIKVALKMLMVLPICMGTFLMWRAWRTNVMPAGRVHHLKEAVFGMF